MNEEYIRHIADQIKMEFEKNLDVNYFEENLQGRIICAFSKSEEFFNIYKELLLSLMKLYGFQDKIRK